MKCKLSSILDGMERANIDEIFYLNEKNGRVWESFDSEQFYIDNGETVEDDMIDDSIPLPTSYEINDYNIMVEFINTISDVQLQKQLQIVIQGKGAFRRFKDSCINYGLIQEWYRFKNLAYYDFAKEWCEWHCIDFEDDVNLEI